MLGGGIYLINELIVHIGTPILLSVRKSAVVKAAFISIGGSVVEFSPATRETRVRFPANALALTNSLFEL